MGGRQAGRGEDGGAVEEGGEGSARPPLRPERRKTGQGMGARQAGRVEDGGAVEEVGRTRRGFRAEPAGEVSWTRLEIGDWAESPIPDRQSLVSNLPRRRPSSAPRPTGRRAGPAGSLWKSSGRPSRSPPTVPGRGLCPAPTSPPPRRRVPA